MGDSLFNYVRSQRKRSGLTDDELAFLIEQRSHTSISLIESGERIPTLGSALALQVVFGLEPRELFSGLWERVEDSVMRRTKVLYDRLERKTDRLSNAKRELFERMARWRHDRNGSDIEA